jgi:hypothetical protein
MGNSDFPSIKKNPRQEECVLKSRKLWIEISKNKTHIFLPMCDSMDFLKSVMYYVAWTYECFF